MGELQRPMRLPGITLGIHARLPERHIQLCLALAAIASAQDKPSVPTEAIEALASARIELVTSTTTIEVESTRFRAVNIATWATKGMSAATVAPKGTTQIRLGTINIQKLPFDLLLVKLDARSKISSRCFEVEVAPNKSGLVRDRDEIKARLLFEPYQVKVLSLTKPIQNPKPVQTPDGTSVINLIQPLAPGHYAVVPALYYATTGTAQMTKSPTLPGWDFDVTE